eukprot:2227985-Rhodomonas_salina.1
MKTATVHKETVAAFTWQESLVLLLVAVVAKCSRRNFHTPPAQRNCIFYFRNYLRNPGNCLWCRNVFGCIFSVAMHQTSEESKRKSLHCTSAQATTTQSGVVVGIPSTGSKGNTTTSQW